MRDKRLGVSVMLFKLIGASLLKTSRKWRFLNRHSGPALRPGLSLAFVRTMASTAIRHAEEINSTGTNTAMKWRHSGAVIGNECRRQLVIVSQQRLGSDRCRDLSIVTEGNGSRLFSVSK